MSIKSDGEEEITADGIKIPVKIVRSRAGNKNAEDGVFSSSFVFLLDFCFRVLLNKYIIRGIYVQIKNNVIAIYFFVEFKMPLTKTTVTNTVPIIAHKITATFCGFFNL